MAVAITLRESHSADWNGWAACLNDGENFWDWATLSSGKVAGRTHPAPDGKFTLVLEEFPYGAYVRDSYPGYAEAKASMQDDWDSFYALMPAFKGILEEKRRDVEYTLWSYITSPYGLARYPMIQMFAGIMASQWQMCQNAVALQEDIDLAIGLLLGPIDRQSPEGQLADSYDDFACEKQLIKVIDDLEHTQVDEEQIARFLPEVFRKFDWLDKDDIVKRVVMREFGRFMKYYSNAPELEEVKSGKGDKSDRAEERASRKRDRNHTPEEGFTRLFINVGKVDGIHTSQIIEQINQRLHGPRIDIGRIDLMKTFSFFEVQSDAAQDVVDALSGSYMKGRQINVEIAEADNEGHNDRSERKSRPEREERHSRSERSERDAHHPKRNERHQSEKDRREKPAKSKKEPKNKHRSNPSYTRYGNSSTPHTGRSGRKGRAVSDEDWRKFFE